MAQLVLLDLSISNSLFEIPSLSIFTVHIYQGHFLLTLLLFPGYSLLVFLEVKQYQDTNIVTWVALKIYLLMLLFSALSPPDILCLFVAFGVHTDITSVWYPVSSPLRACSTLEASAVLCPRLGILSTPLLSAGRSM